MQIMKYETTFFNTSSNAYLYVSLTVDTSLGIQTNVFHNFFHNDSLFYISIQAVNLDEFPMRIQYLYFF